MDQGPGPGTPPRPHRRRTTSEGTTADCDQGGRGSPTRYCLTATASLRLAAILILMTARVCLACKVDHCTREYQLQMGEQGVSGPGPTPAFCLVLRKYGDCIRATARSCRGNLKYHSTYSTVSNWISEYNCSSHASTAAGMRPPAATEEHLPCTFKHPPSTHASAPARRYRHCSLSGDPHLKSFRNEYMTCRIKGAWPLVDNAYLAVQVTNEPVAEGSPATATTKVTVIIKGRGNTGCTQEKTYEATGDTPLPTAFIDGSRRSGPNDSVSLAVGDGGSRVEIRLRHADATIVIRRLGRYLAFAARMPEEVAVGSPPRHNGLPENHHHHPALELEEEAGLQLCVTGCPLSERLETVPAGTTPLLPQEAAEKRCRLWNLTDHYLDWCVFDSMTASSHRDVDLAAAAAYAALADVNRLDPEGAALTLKNRTAARRMTSDGEPPGQSLKSSANVDSPSGTSRGATSSLPPSLHHLLGCVLVLLMLSRTNRQLVASCGGSLSTLEGRASGPSQSAPVFS